jgi:hypothetical protein
MNDNDFKTSVLSKLDSLEKKQDDMLKQVSNINIHGCAQRADDLARIKKLESWKDRGIIGFIGLLLSAMYALASKVLGGS